MSYIKRHQLGAKINKRIYDAVDPTQDYPSTAHSIKLGVDVIKGNRTGKIKEPVADAAWRKRLGLKYDKKYLPSINDSTVTLPDKYINEILIDTNVVKERIFDNKVSEDLKNAIEKGSVSLNPEYIRDIQRRDALVQKDTEYLDKLRDLYKGKSVSVNEFQAWKNRDLYKKDGTFNENVVSPLSVLKNFTLRKKDNGDIEFSDIYDFNQYEKFVPGKPFRIEGTIKKAEHN